MDNVIEIKQLYKCYGANQVLNGIDLTVHKGEILGLLGVNGAGKTTTLECIEGLRSYDSGTITINGKIGIQLQSSTLQAHVRPMEAVKLFAKWTKTAPDNEMLNSLGIPELSKKKYADLSTGQKRRLHLALALIGDPDIIFLDEPTAGLDVEGRVSLHEQIRALRSHGKTIILASHDMAEVEYLCDRIAVLKDGCIAFIGTVDEFTANGGNRHIIRIKTADGQEEYETENIAETLLKILTDYTKKGIVINSVQTDIISLERHFINVVRSAE
ncbi:MAG: ABC transporter ATP-binding protein [Clostridiales bacterium]|nr:ABC transporter ATP-binding protein [Clostridiales bacterium]